ncbi:M10 family metallopeptidase [Microvirga terrestris]|uniref:M10 family metallopeptidase C-terminal domain-containing protein n=1 Tax=Microvirga terrestris TaxID=2791024 RepID=A0ABS0HWU0_9HYPH|nr:M10 family metallopeptidase [Microvirga terrestris]MBF9197746.1 M10 family metallopeptidase C-terminal domain-containing protein [Microvirga terrestris]
MSWVSDAFRSAGQWVVDKVEDIGDWFGDQIDSAWNWLSDNVSGLPLKFFAAMGTVFPSWSFGSVQYFLPKHADNDVNALMAGSKWSGSTITYSMPDHRSDYELINPSADGFERLSVQAENGIRNIMDVVVAGYVNTGIVYSGRGNAKIQIAGFDPGNVITRSHGYYPGVPVYSGDTWLTTGDSVNYKKGSHSYFLAMHELGHALGMKHSHDHADGIPRMSEARDTTEYTVMSYNETTNRPQSFMQYDIAALQAMYGADFTTNSGNTIYSWRPDSGETYVNGVSLGEASGGFIFLTLWDGGGIDTYDMSKYSGNALIDLTPGGSSRFSDEQLAKKNSSGATVKGNVYNPFLYNGDTRSLIENAIGGTGNDKILGNQAANILEGRNGDDILTGGAGNDTLDGGAGDDILYSGSGADRLNGGAGLGDMVAYGSTNGQGITVNLANPQFNTGEAAGDTYNGIENVAGTAFGDVLIGDTKNNILYGLGSDDVLRGGLGADVLVGGEGFNWASYMEATSGVVADLANNALNTGEAAGDTYIEIRGLQGSNHADHLAGDSSSLGNALAGLGGNDILTGRAGNDTLEGGEGDDILNGGAGADLLIGGAGLGDMVAYNSVNGQGVTVNLAKPQFNSGEAVGDTYDGIENVAGTASTDILTGDAKNNILYGLGSDDILRGGLGADVLVGGEGFDWASYAEATSGVRVDLVNWGVNSGEAAGDGFIEIEALQGSNYGDSLAGDGNGNALSGLDGTDVLHGRGGNDYLNGGGSDDILNGGVGADTLVGGGGFDWASYIDANSGVTVDLANRGANTGEAAGDYFESIHALQGSTFGDALKGDESGNALSGLEGTDLLQGRGGNDHIHGGEGGDTLSGGTGSDYLIGAAGADRFRFDTALGPSNVDMIVDFSVSEDKIELDGRVFAGLGSYNSGGLVEWNFSIGSRATTQYSQIIYNSATGELFYDADGVGNGVQIKFADISRNMALTHLNFLLV